jgi:long-chain acyl-CoA synthetase
MRKRPFAWEKNYPPGTSWDAPLDISTLGAIFDKAVATYGRRPVLEFRDRLISYSELGEMATATAAAFLALEPGESKPIALYLPNVPYHPIAFFAGAKAGIPLVHLSPLDAERELEHKLTDSGARTIVTTNFSTMLPHALKMLERGLVDRVIVGDDAEWGPGRIPIMPVPEMPGVLSFAKLMAEPSVRREWPPVTPDDLALLQYTGGTTGKPRAAMLSHANLTAAVSIYNIWTDAVKAAMPEKPWAEVDAIIGVLPFFHMYALTSVLLRNVSAGNRILLRTRFDAEQTLHDIEVKRATAFPGVPTMWIALTSRPDFGQRDLSSLTFCGSGGAPLPVEVESRFKQVTGLKLGGGWGMTETSPAGTNVPAYMETPPGTVGLPLPGVEMEIVALDDPYRVLPSGEAGEIRVRGPNVTKGYWKRPEETARAILDGGWLLTGDIGTMDENGFFYVVDRKKDMIISGGFNVYPQMIEQAIYEHPAVAEVIVIGVPDAYRGEAAKAFVSLKPGASEFTLDELNVFLADKLGRHEVPAQLEFRENLPRTAVGKLSKVELKAEEREKAAKASKERLGADAGAQ